MKRLLLIRHGETDWNRAGRFQGHTDIVLNDEGRAQARRLAARLVDRRVGAITSSDLRRARETAEIIAESLSLRVAAIDPELRERSYGCFEGLTRDECALCYPDDWARHLAGGLSEPPGAEPRVEVSARVVRAVTRIVSTHATDDSSVVIVTHGGAMRVFLEAATGHSVPPIPNLAVYELEWNGARFSSPILF